TLSSRALFVIPARGGSRRILRKNVRSMAGIPLVGWAVRIARAVAGPDDIVACSTDDTEIAAVASEWGAAVLARPAALATDDASSLSVAVHALDTLGRSGPAFDLLVLVQPTSPLTEPADLAAALELARRTGRSVTSIAVGTPTAWRHRRNDDGTLRVRPAGPEPDHVLTGGFYVVAPDALRRVGAFIEPGVTIGHLVSRERAIDIDEPDDLLTAAAILRARPVAPIVVDGHEVGGSRVFVIAEAGVNHDGDLGLARRLIDAAADAGADAVKFQTFVPEELAAPTAPTAGYQQERDGGGDQRAMLERLALPADAWADLQGHARARGIVFLSTPFDDASADLLDRLDVPAFKV
ncbi:MAG: N-acetylneuraminate synthase family protein, partial [Candidatus Limnocylindrales bacterium]